MEWFKKLFGQSKGESEPALKIVVHEAFDGAIRIFEAPVEPGWGYTEDERSGDGFTVMVVKYMLPAEPFPLVLVAKIYTLAYPPEVPADTDWPEAFDTLFSRIDACDVNAARQLTMKTELPATQAVVTGLDTQGAPIVVRERRAILANEQFVVTAIGPADTVLANVAVIDRWFANVAFVPYEP